LKQFFNTHDMPMVASNLVEKETDGFYAKPYTLVTSGPMSIAVLSMVPEGAFSSYDSTSAKGDLNILPPETALSELLAELEGKADVTILFTDLNMADTSALVSGLPGIDIAISNDTGHKTATSESSPGPPYVFPLGLERMSLGRLTLMMDADGGVTVTTHEFIALDNAVPSDETMNELIYEAYQEKFKQEKKAEKLRKIVEFGEQNEEIQELQKLSPMEYINRINQQNSKGSSE
jgi:2',3'-cyclic-nucleotide 2'-phosphodiesterase (5'-nucleotidase family)